MGCSEGLNELFRGSLYPYRDYLDEVKELSQRGVKTICARLGRLASPRTGRDHASYGMYIIAKQKGNIAVRAVLAVILLITKQVKRAMFA